jgi:transposase
MVPVPDEADEDARRCIRERTELISERVGLTNRIGAVLATLGVTDYNPLLRNRHHRLAELRTGLGEPLPPNAHAKIARLLARLELVLAQIAELERERDAVVETETPDHASKMIQQLISLRGIGVQSATVLVREAFVRRFANGKALGSYAGLTSSPYSSGGIDREQGIGKGGNRRLRTVMVELAWMDALPTRCCSGLLVPRTGWINWAARSQNHGGGLSTKTADRAVEIRHRRHSA